MDTYKREFDTFDVETGTDFSEKSKNEKSMENNLPGKCL
jgi:hypothetical protein